MAKHAESSSNASDPDANPRISQVSAVKGGKSQAGVGVRRRQRGWESRERKEKNGRRKGGLKGGAPLFHFVDASLKVRRSDGQRVLRLVRG